MLIKFLEHGKGSAAKAASYVLDNVDHLNRERAGVQVLTGDPITFTSICDANPNVWKYTSAVIAWSKEDNPTDKEINEVLYEFEQHAFSGLEPHQYHMFSTLHIEDDGSKHIHILVPRLELDSGKALNIAPPGHEKYYDPLRDFFNHRNNWSRPDDPIKLATTQTPSYIAKLEAQAEKILQPEKLNTLKKKDFCRYIDNYVKTLFKLPFVKTRKDIADALRETQGIQGVKEGKNYLAVTLNDGKTHRLKGDFYNDEFEIGVYKKHIESAERYGAIPEYAQQAASEARDVCVRLRRTRYDYYQQTYLPRNSNTPMRGHFGAYPTSPEYTQQNRTEGLYQPSPKHQRRDQESGIDVGHFPTSDSQRFEQRNQHDRTSDNATQEKIRRIGASTDQSGQLEQTTSFTGGTSDYTSNPRDSIVGDTQARNANDGTLETREIALDSLRHDRTICVTDPFKFLADLSDSYQRESHFATERSNQQQFRDNQTPRGNYSGSSTASEIKNAERNRQLFGDTTRAFEERKRTFEETEQHIEESTQRIRRCTQRISDTKKLITESDKAITRERSTTTNLFTDFTTEVFDTVTRTIASTVDRAKGDFENPTQTRDVESNSIRPDTNSYRERTRESYYTFGTELFEREKQNNRLSKPVSGFSNETLYAAIAELKQREYQKELNREQEQSRSSTYGMSM